MKDNRDLQQVLRIDAKNVFLEVMLSGLIYDKVLVNFKSYDLNQPSGSRTQAEIGIFMDMYDAELFARDIMSGRIFKLAQKAVREAHEKKSKYPNHVYESLGGIPGKKQPDGIPIARVLQLSPGSDLPWVFCAKQGPGHETKEGLIVLDHADQTIRVPMYDESLKKFAIALERVTRIWEQLRFMPVREEPMRIAQARRQQVIDNAKERSARRNGTY